MKLLYKIKFGSHLYGTNTVNSDTDYKGVYLAELADIVLKKDKATVAQNTKPSGKDSRNSSTDIDIEYKDLREFLREAMSGQTYALDMLFAPRSVWEKSSPEWEFIYQNRQKLLSKNVAPFLGYIRQQTAKYGLKGARLAELQRVLAYFSKLPEKDLIGDYVDGLPLSEFVSIYSVMNERPHGLSPINESYLEVLGKKFQFKSQIKNLLGPLKKFDEEYGERSRKAALNEGIDWKAVSHAFRCCFELIELAEKQEITFPLEKRDYLVQIKTGQIPWNQLKDDLSLLMEQAFKALENSALPEQPDKKFWDDFILQTYLKNHEQTKNT